MNQLGDHNKRPSSFSSHSFELESDEYLNLLSAVRFGLLAYPHRCYILWIDKKSFESPEAYLVANLYNWNVRSFGAALTVERIVSKNIILDRTKR